MPVRPTFDVEMIAQRLQPPVLVISTLVGRGMYTLGQAFVERFSPDDRIEHIAVEDCLPSSAVSEDLRRYKVISSRIPVLLNLVYRVPFFYRRKYARESRDRPSDLSKMKKRIAALNPKTVLCVSHRPAFWVSTLKRRDTMGFKLWGVLGEYGNTLAWKYIFWDQMDGFLSPIAREALDYPFPQSLEFEQIELPARRAYYGLADRMGQSQAVLLVCGYWGQGPIIRVLQAILAQDSELRVIVVCGESRSVLKRADAVFSSYPNVQVYGVVDSLLPFLAESSCVVTKPGISTLLEAHAARRKIFLLKGMPVAEDNNARYAIEHFGAEWFTRDTFGRWCRAHHVHRSDSLEASLPA